MGGRQEIGMFLVALGLLLLSLWPRQDPAPRPELPCARQAALLEPGGGTRLVCLDRTAVLGQGSGACKLEDIPAGASVTFAADGSCQVAEGGMPGRVRLLAGEKLDLNRASAEDLEALPDIGPALAERIVKTRTELGRFESVEDLLEVPGIGEKRLAKLARFLTVEPPSSGQPGPSAAKDD